MPLYGNFVHITGDTMTGALINDAQIGVGVSSINTAYGLEVTKTFTNASGERRGLSFVLTSNPGSNSSGSNFGFLGFSEHSSTFNNTGQISGGFTGSRVSAVATISTMYGAFSEVQSTANAAITFAVGQVGSINDTGGADYTTAYGTWIICGNATGSTIATFHGVHVSDPFGTGAVTANHALYVENQTKGSTNRGLSFAGSGINNSIEWSGDTNLYRGYASGVATDDDIWLTQDNASLFVGAGFDFQITHNGTNTLINNFTGNLIIEPGGQLEVVDDVEITTVGKGFNVKEGSNARMGIVTLSSGAATVNTTAVTASSRIFLETQGGTVTNVGAHYVSARSAGTSFTITSLNILDASDVAWLIMEPS
jgi:hypothetical protein